MRVDGRWPLLAGVSPVFIDGPPRHLAAVEPLAVQAFTTAVAKAASRPEGSKGPRNRLLKPLTARARARRR
jgi:hypothetical protein